MSGLAALGRSFWVVFPLLSLIPIGILAGYAFLTLSDRMEIIRRSERFAVDLELQAVMVSLEQVANDLCLISSQNELKAFLAGGGVAAREAMATEYIVLSRNAQVYDQVRYLDETGREVVRVNNTNGLAVRVPEDQLQTKSQRYYFTEAMALEPGQVYLSPLDLNVERGEIEIPHKPMLRLATPVADELGRKRGLVVINYMAQDMLDWVASTGIVTLGQPLMLDDAGTLFVSPGTASDWTVMVPGAATRDAQDLFPDAWAAMNEQWWAAVRTSEGLFTFENYRPLNGIRDCAGAPAPRFEEAEDHGIRWIMASYVPETILKKLVRDLIVSAVWIGIPVLLLLAVGTRAVLTMQRDRRRYQENLEVLARFDPLTGLFNRETFDHRLEDEIVRSSRHKRKFALLYLDLDGFKTINDTLGHEVGDRVLKDVAKVLTENSRAVDTPSRRGGDEFVVLLSEVAGLDSACGVAAKILDRIRALSWHDQSVGASIGVALWPDHGANAGVVVRAADEAMYVAKTAGKNRICVAQGGEAGRQ